MSEIFEYFFDAYFHQDWRDDYGSSLDAVEDFNQTEPSDSKAQLIYALKELLNQEDLPQDTINKLGGNFRPESENMDVKVWISKALEILE